MLVGNVLHSYRDKANICSSRAMTVPLQRAFFKRLSWCSLNWAFQILPDSSLSFNFSRSFYKDFIKYLKTQQTSAHSCFQEICTVVMLHFRQSPGRMAVEKSITISVGDPHSGETITEAKRRYMLVHRG